MSTEYLLERLVGAALMIATALFFLAGAVNPLGYFFAMLCGFLALWFLFPNKSRPRRNMEHRAEEHAGQFD